MADQSMDRGELLTLTAEIVAAHVGNNAVAGPDFAALIHTVFDTPSRLAADKPSVTAELTPAMPLAEKSFSHLTADWGNRFLTLEETQ